MPRTSKDKPVVKPSEIASTMVQRLAPELLTEIFLHCIPTHPFQCSMYDRSQAPLLLGRVCSSWRTFSISSPSLWSRIALVYDRYFCIDCKKTLDATKLWISRSGSQPLTIGIHYYRDGDRLHEDYISQAIGLVVSQSSRWKSIDMTIPSALEGVVLTPFRKGCWPRLENFACTIIGNETPVVVHSLNLSCAPRLQEFRHNSHDGVQIKFGGRMHFIKILEIASKMEPGIPGISLRDLSAYLTYCPLLEVLSITMNKTWTNPRQETPSIIELSHLRGFSLTLSPGIDPGYLFDTLCLPALTYLELLMQDVDNFGVDWPHLKTMLARSRPPLQWLLLSYVRIKEATLIECLSYIPSLELIRLDGIHCTDTILDFLTVHENDPSGSICPYLKNIRFGRASHFSANVMIEMILSRRSSTNGAGGGNGMALQIIDCGDTEMDTIISNPEIAKCVEDGLRFTT